MKQVVSLLALLTIYFVSTSAHSSRVIAPHRGYTAPQLEIKNGDAVVSTSDFSGEYVLLTFWSSTDAPSRVRCNNYEALGHSQNAKINRVAVNLDSSERLFEEIVKYDNMDAVGQYHLNPEDAAKAIKQYEMESGLKSFLIDPAGRIIAINPTLEEIPS